MKELTTELERSRLSFKGDLADKSKQLDALVSERNSLRRTSESTSGSPSRTLFSAVTPSKAKGSTRDESIQEILTTLSDAGNGVSENDIASPALATVESGEELSTTLEEPCATSEKELQSAKYQITIVAAKLPIRQKMLNTLAQAQIQGPELMLGEI